MISQDSGAKELQIPEGLAASALIDVHMSNAALHAGSRRLSMWTSGAHAGSSEDVAASGTRAKKKPLVGCAATASSQRHPGAPGIPGSCSFYLMPRFVPSAAEEATVPQGSRWRETQSRRQPWRERRFAAPAS